MGKKVLIVGGLSILGLFVVLWILSSVRGQKIMIEQGATLKPNTSLANPASVNCKEKGGKTQIVNGPKGQYGLCNFEDDQACEEWALLKGDCPVGGVKTIGFDTEAQKYCAWVGGQTLAIPNAQCTLPDGTVCGDEALYKGECNLD